MKHQELRAQLLLLSAAAIWGLAFVAQRIVVKYLGPFTFNGIRFALGSLSLVPLLIFSKKKSVILRKKSARQYNVCLAGIIAGCILFTAASLQQIGLEVTTAGKAAFITGLYIILVPILGLFLKQRLHFGIWFGVAIATTGLYFLSVTQSFSIANGDLLELGGAFFFAIHILLIGHFATKEINTLKLCIIQFLTCSVLSMAVALGCEKITVANLRLAAIPIIYGGICSVGIAYTLQVIGQKQAKPSHAAIILSMESVFASLGGWLILNENLGIRGYLGCFLMLSGMLLSQLPNFGKRKINDITTAS